MPNLKKIAFVLLFVFLCGCAQSNTLRSDSYADMLNEAAYIPPATARGGAEPFTEIITGTVSYAQQTEAPTTTQAVAEITEPVKAVEETTEEAPALYVITPSGKKYHYPTCRMVKSIKEYLTKEEAERKKYEPCKICNPK